MFFFKKNPCKLEGTYVVDIYSISSPLGSSTLFTNDFPFNKACCRFSISRLMCSDVLDYHCVPIKSLSNIASNLFNSKKQIVSLCLLKSCS